MTTPADKRDIRRFKMVRTSPAVIEPANRRLMFDPATFRGPTQSAPVLNNHINLTSHVAGRILTAWADRLTGAIVGDIEIFPDNIRAASDVRALLAVGHRGASINYEAGRRQPNQDGTTGIFDWELGHLAVVGQGADPAAGPMDLSADGNSAMFNLEIMPQEGDMTQPNFDLASVLPQLSAAIAQGVREGNQATDTEGPVVAEQMSVMLKIAASQSELYKPGMLQDLALDLAMGKITAAEDFRAKLTSIQIQPRPIAPGTSDAEFSNYDLNAVVKGIMANDMSGMSKELSLSNEIRRGSEVASRLAPNAIAVPLRELASHSGTTGTGASGTSVEEQTVAVFDSTVPDSTDILPYVTRVPTGPGFAKSVAVTVPTPSHVPEPGDSGYSKSGDAVGVGTDMTPHVLLDFMLMTRVLQVLEPEFEANVLEIVMRRFLEAQNRALVVGGVDSPFPTGVYGHAGIGSTADLTAVVETDDIEAALAASVHVAGPDSGRAIITSATTVTAMRQLAQPAAVSALMSPTPAMNGQDMIRDARVFTCGFFPAANPYRGVVGPWSDCLMKEWDGAMYVSRRYEAGINTLLTELFWDARIMHPELFHRFRQD